MNDKNDLTHGPIVKKLILYFLPMLAGNLFHQLYNAVDAIVVGKFVGTQALAAVGGSAANIINLIIGFFVALSSGSSVIVAQKYGAGDKESVSKAAHTAIIFCILCGVSLTLVFGPMARTFLIWLKAPEDTLDLATLYLRLVSGGAIFTLMYNMGAGILRAVGDSRKPFLYLCVSCIVNIVLDVLFVVAFKMGVAGVALATVIAQAISSILVLINMFRTNDCYKLELKKLRIHWLTLKSMLSIGIPSGLQSSMYGVSNMLISMGVNTLGTVVVASWALTGKLDGVYWSAANAAGAAIMTFIAQNYGAGDIKRVRECVKKSNILFMCFTIAISAFLLLAAPFLLPLFTDDAAVISTTWRILTYFVPFYFTWTYIEVYSGSLRGTGDALVPTIILGIGICATRVIWLFTVFKMVPTLFCLSMCYPVSWVLTDIPLYIRYRSDKWNKLKDKEQQTA